MRQFVPMTDDMLENVDQLPGHWCRISVAFHAGIDSAASRTAR